MTKCRSRVVAVAVVFLAVMAFGTHADAADKTIVRGGMLTCHEASGWGLIFGSSRKLKCTYAMQKGYEEHYVGSINKFGVDIGYLSSAVIIWSVIVPTTNLGAGALAGHYGGATASVAAGVGGGANVLIGGLNKSITLQPLSFQGSQGLNIAAGIAEVTLKYVPGPKGLKAGQ